MDNQKFLETLNVPAENMQKCLDAMAKYGDNKWWEPDVDPRTRDALVQEAERAWKYQVGVTSELERQERVNESIESLRVWAKEHGKQVIDVQLPNANEK